MSQDDSNLPFTTKVLTSLDEVRAAVAEIRREATITAERPRSNWLGFDMEWVPEKRTGKAKDIVIVTRPDDFTTRQVAMLQIATTSTAYLFRMCAFVSPTPADPQLPCECPLELAALLTDTSLYFAGIGIDGDRVRFFSDFGGVWITNAVDVTAMFTQTTKCVAHPTADPAMAAKVRDAADDPACRSLSDYAAHALGVTMGKDLNVTCSNWCSASLTREQIQYAAADAWVSLRLLHCTADYLGIRGDTAECLQPYVLTTQPRASTTRCAKAVADTSSKQQQNQRPRKPVMGYEGRKQPYYGNIKVLSCDDPDRVLFTVSITKADWYLKENLAVVVEEGALNTDGSISGRVIRLKFSPNLDREEDSDLRPDATFFAAEKANCCVVCGGNPPGGMVRFFVVPMAYRKHFPREFVSHNSFDIVLVCVNCMKTVNLVYDAERRKLSQEYRFPIGWISSKSVSEVASNSPSPVMDGSGTASPPPPLGAALAEHNRIIVRMTKDASALIFAFITQEKKHLGAALTGNSKENASLPPHRWDALFLQLHSTTHQYDFPDPFTSPPTASAPAPTAQWQDKYWDEILTAIKRRHERLHSGADELTDDDAYRIATEEPIPLHGLTPNVDDPPTTVPLTWKDVYAMMKAERWKVKLRASPTPAPLKDDDAAVADDDDDSGGDDATTTADLSTNHFQFVVLEITRRAMTDSDAVNGEKAFNEWRKAVNAAPSAPGNAKPEVVIQTPRPAIEGVCRFVYRWRTLFLGKVKPRFMPVGWYPEQGLIGVPSPTSPSTMQNKVVE